MKRKCTIQIVEEDPTKGGRFGTCWTCLSKDIDYTNKEYTNIIYFPKEEYYDIPLNLKWFHSLFHGHNDAYFSMWDIIRNPTIEELNFISRAAKKLGLKINLKKGICVGLEK